MKNRTFWKVFRLSKNKTFEFQIGTWEHWSYFNLETEFSRKRDHAGFTFDIQILGVYLRLCIHDNRHWNRKFNCWCGDEPKPTPETHPNWFNPDGTMKKFISPGISTIERD
jgi:hypothetical protein